MKQIFGLSQLEILDMSRNKLTEVPEEIERIKALRVLSLHHNYIEDLPNCIGHINTLRMLKLAGNPLNPDLRDLIEGNENSPATPALPTNENEKDTYLTTGVIEYLRARASIQVTDFDGPLETPRAQSRFPVHPNDYGYSTSGSESAPPARSPGFIRPAVPGRSHYRIASNQNNSLQTAAARRPTLAPLTLGNERNRSNSESILQATQATQNNRNKRMGMVPKKNAELKVLDDAKTNRNSHHFRGQSHSSALRNSIRPGDQVVGDAHSPNSNQGTFVRRLSSVPEQKQNFVSSDNVVEGAKGILYALHLVHPHLPSLIALVKDGKSRRASLERIHHQVSVQLDYLDQSLHEYNNMAANKGKNFKIHAKKTVCRATHACLAVYQQIGLILLRNVKQLVADGDPRYIRTLLLLLYGSWNEARNARKILVSHRRSIEPQKDQNTLKVIPAIKQLSHEESPNPPSEASLTPTQEQPQRRSERRWRNGSIVQQSISHTNLNASLGNGPFNGQIPTPSYSNVPSRSTSRSVSRSHSRAGAMRNTESISIVSTPRSGESFNSSVIFNPRSRSGSVATNHERSQHSRSEQDHFERIYVTLLTATEQGLQVIPYLEPRFLSSLSSEQKAYPRKPSTIARWQTIVSHTRFCLETSQQLKMTLSLIKVNDPTDRTNLNFWRLAKRFVDAYGDLLVSLREARTLNILEPDIRHKIRPVHKSTVDAARFIENSPWNRLTSEFSELPSVTNSRAPTPVQNGYPPPSSHLPAPPPTPSQQNGYPYPQTSYYQSGSTYHRRPNTSNGSTTSLSSPYNTNTSVPATPLSAALGPAAQATVPSTSPGSGGIGGIFEGGLWQRADSLLNMQQQQTTFRRGERGGL